MSRAERVDVLLNGIKHECETAQKEIFDYMEQRDNLRAENAKLRKFAALAWQTMTRNEPMFVWKDMVEDARELGIEVGA